MKQTERFELQMTITEKKLLRLLAEIEHISAAAVMRRLLWQEAEKKQLTVSKGKPGNGKTHQISQGNVHNT